MPKPIVIYDACVLYPAPLRDLLMHLAMTDLFKAKWTNQIHEEWIRNVLIQRPDLNKKQLERTRDLMNLHALDCLVDGYQKMISELALPDSNDRHVLAAAIHASASKILTYNLKDFPNKILNQFKIEAQHPDNFLCELINSDSMAVCSAIRKLRTGLKKPPIHAEQYLATLEKQRLSQFVLKLKNFIDLI